MKRPLEGRRVIEGAQMLPVVQPGSSGRASWSWRMVQSVVKEGEVATGTFCLPLVVEKA